MLSSYHLVLFCIAYSAINLASSAIPYIKGEKGDVGHPGIRGLRGYRGEKGSSGQHGSIGPKGNQGEPGSPGPSGIQGPPGVIGPAGKPGLQGPPGNTGRQGSAGPIGPRGLKGHTGIKGEKGIKGSRGIAGVDGKPGGPGHVGPAGPTGAKGEKGRQGAPGHIGLTGPAGPPAPLINNENFKKYLEPLHKEINILKVQLQALSSTERPIAHLHGDGSTSSSFSGSWNVITNWFTGTGQWYSPTLQGGMKYSNGKIIVPQDGLYYIYTQVQYKPSEFQSQCRVRIRSSSQSLNIIQSPTYYDSSSVKHYNTRYTGGVRKLQKGDDVMVRTSSVSPPCTYQFHANIAHFGVFQIR